MSALRKKRKLSQADLEIGMPGIKRIRLINGNQFTANECIKITRSSIISSEHTLHISSDEWDYKEVSPDHSNDKQISVTGLASNKNPKLCLSPAAKSFISRNFESNDEKENKYKSKIEKELHEDRNAGFLSWCQWVDVE